MSGGLLRVTFDEWPRNFRTLTQWEFLLAAGRYTGQASTVVSSEAQTKRLMSTTNELWQFRSRHREQKVSRRRKRHSRRRTSSRLKGSGRLKREKWRESKQNVSSNIEFKI